MNIEGHQEDYVFKHADGKEVLVRRLPEPYVSHGQLEKARNLVRHFTILNPGASREIILVSMELLVQPPPIPKEVQVVSVVDEYNLSQTNNCLEPVLN
jgi:hypothetical protein